MKSLVAKGRLGVGVKEKQPDHLKLPQYSKTVVGRPPSASPDQGHTCSLVKVFKRRRGGEDNIAALQLPSFLLGDHSSQCLRAICHLLAAHFLVLCNKIILDVSRGTPGKVTPI